MFGCDMYHKIATWHCPGITSLLVNGKQVLLTDALSAAEKELMGDYAHLWPLTKVLYMYGYPPSNP